MSDEKKQVVTPTGRIVFLKNLFEPNNKEKYTATLLFNDSQDLKRLRSMMLEEARTKFDEKIINSSKFKWGMKKPDEEAMENFDFFDEETVILNCSTKFPIEVKGTSKGPDGKYEDLIDGDLKAGDYCRFLVSCYAWENTTEGKNRGVSFNVSAVQMIKKGEALYQRKPSDDLFAEADIDIEVDTKGEESDYVDGEDSIEW
jgi:hypothetical protein